MREVIFFTHGDANDISTWSNVPYLFSKTLESKGIIVHRVNINVFPNRIFGIIWSRMLRPLINLVYPHNMYSYQRTPFANYKVNKIIKRAVNKYTQSDYCIFLTYDYYNKFSSIPSVLYADVTFEMEKIGRRNQTPCFLEKFIIRQEERAIQKAKLVIPLFKKPAKELKEKGYTNIRYCNHYVINNVYNDYLNPQNIIENKKNSNKILFIGNKTTYYKGALLLIEAFRILKDKYKDLELHIVAMEDSDFAMLPEGVACHGYLRKDIETEKNRYYDLLLSSKIICNPTPKWAGISSIMEAMYFYTPFIIAPFDDFKEYIGEKLDCGYFNEKFDVNELVFNLERLLTTHDYEKMAIKCHEHVENFTWPNFTDWFIRELENTQKDYQ